MELSGHRQFVHSVLIQQGREEQDLEALDLPGFGIETRDDVVVEVIAVLFRIWWSSLDVENVSDPVVLESQPRRHSIPPLGSRRAM